MADRGHPRAVREPGGADYGGVGGGREIPAPQRVGAG